MARLIIGSILGQGHYLNIKDLDLHHHLVM